jgi:hypothetical protein
MVVAVQRRTVRDQSAVRLSPVMLGFLSAASTVEVLISGSDAFDYDGTPLSQG